MFLSCESALEESDDSLKYLVLQEHPQWGHKNLSSPLPVQSKCSHTLLLFLLAFCIQLVLHKGMTDLLRSINIPGGKCVCNSGEEYIRCKLKARSMGVYQV